MQDVAAVLIRRLPAASGVREEEYYFLPDEPAPYRYIRRLRTYYPVGDNQGDRTIVRLRAEDVPKEGVELEKPCILRFYRGAYGAMKALVAFKWPA